MKIKQVYTIVNALPRLDYLICKNKNVLPAVTIFYSTSNYFTDQQIKCIPLIYTEKSPVYFCTKCLETYAQIKN